jgi:hypothetical protein
MPASLSLRSHKTFVGFVVAGLIAVASLAPVLGASPPAKPTISAEASAALAQMAKTLSSQQFSFQAHTLRVYADADGRFLHIAHTIKVLIRRPDRLRIDIDGDDGATQVFYDGRTLVLFGPAKKEYVSLPVPDTIEAMIKEAEKRVGFDFPLEDFLSETSDKALLSGVTEAKIVNQVTIDGAPANHLTLFQPPGLEIELWLTADDKALPKRVYITYRSVPGQPNFIASFSDWNFSVTPSDADFTFQPPEGAKQVELKSAAAPPPAPAPQAKGAKP